MSLAKRKARRRQRSLDREAKRATAQAKRADRGLRPMLREARRDEVERIEERERRDREGEK